MKLIVCESCEAEFRIKHSLNDRIITLCIVHFVEVMLTIQIMWMRLNGMKMIKGIGWTIILIICVWGSVNLKKNK